MSKRRGVEQFLNDVKPFFYGKPLTYVDVGAYKGVVFKKLIESKLRIKDALLIEPNPTARAELELSARLDFTGHRLVIAGVAAGSSRGTVKMRSAESMTQVVEENPEEAPIEEQGFFQARVEALDDLVADLPDRHVSLLKIDVEGFELQVLSGAKALLSDHRADVVYIEAGIDPRGTQQCYYRAIEDVLIGHGYRLFGVYEQVHEWLDDSPFLRRVNLAYMSPEFASKHPYRLTQELFAAQATIEDLRQQLATVSWQVQNGQHNDERLRAMDEKLLQVTRDREELATRLRCAVRGNQMQVTVIAKHKATIKSLRRESYASRARVKALKGALSKLKGALSKSETRVSELHAQASSWAQERSTLKASLAERDRTVEGLQKKLTQLQAEIDAAQRAREIAAKLESEKLSGERELRRLREDVAAYENTMREVFSIAASLFRDKRRAQVTAAEACARADRTRKHLSYRIGSALVQNAVSPAGWARVPGALVRARLDFKRDQSRATNNRRQAFDSIVMRKEKPLALVVDSRWQRIRVRNSRDGEEISGMLVLSARALSVNPRARASLEFALDGGPAFPCAGAAPAFEASPRGHGPLLWPLEMPHASAQKIVRYKAGEGDIEFSVRKTQGAPAILRIEIHSDEEPLRTAQDDGRKPKQAAKLRSSKAPASASPGRVWEAQRLIEAGEFQKGIELVLTHGNEAERYAAELLRANHAISDEAAWLGHVNSYLQQFAMAPLMLHDGRGSRFSRIHAEPTHIVDRGPLVSVIMPVYQSAPTLEHAAGSILGQTWRPLELIIVDDASTDGTWSIAKELAKKDDRVKVVRNVHNAGPYVCRNIGVRLSRGAFITCQDGDDWSHPERIERHVESMLKADGRLKASLPRMLRMSSDGVFTRVYKRRPDVDDGKLQPALVACMFDAKFFKAELGYWQAVRFGGDSELMWRARHLLGADFPVLRQLSMFCLDAPGSLTSDSKQGGMSPIRREYRTNFQAWHATLSRTTPGAARLPFRETRRRFDVPRSMLVNDAVVRDIEASIGGAVSHGEALPSNDVLLESVERTVDVCIVTNLTYPGGNASSTIDEVRQCLEAGLTVRLLHCQKHERKESLPKRLRTGRYGGMQHLWEDPLAAERKYRCRVLIVRNPSVIIAPKLREALAGVCAEHVVFVINNSMFRPDGTRVYFEDELCSAINGLPYADKRVYPLGPAIRRELLEAGLNRELPIAEWDWCPTFCIGQFPLKQPGPIGSPIRIGRHGRDGREKWLETRHELLMAYPESREFTVRILGGAETARETLGHIPKNWEVLPFGAIEPAEFLHTLDVFVYFPASDLNEAFGRTVIEAILVGVPCLLPTRMEHTFGDLVFYCEPSQVCSALRRLRDSFELCSEFVIAARQRAAARYASDAFLARLATVSAALAERLSDRVANVERLSTERMPEHLCSYARWVATGLGELPRAGVAHTALGARSEQGAC